MKTAPLTYSNGMTVGEHVMSFSIEGDLSLIASLPTIFDPQQIAEYNFTISSVRLTRRTAGTSESTRVDILVNGGLYICNRWR
jgi:hypothetical protein